MNHYATALNPDGGVCLVEADYYDIRDGFVNFYRIDFGYSDLIGSYAVGRVDFVRLQETQDDKGDKNEPKPN